MTAPGMKQKSRRRKRKVRPRRLPPTTEIDFNSILYNLNYEHSRPAPNVDPTKRKIRFDLPETRYRSRSFLPPTTEIDFNSTPDNLNYERSEENNDHASRKRVELPKTRHGSKLSGERRGSYRRIRNSMRRGPTPGLVAEPKFKAKVRSGLGLSGAYLRYRPGCGAHRVYYGGSVLQPTAVDCTIGDRRPWFLADAPSEDGDYVTLSPLRTVASRVESPRRVSPAASAPPPEACEVWTLLPPPQYRDRPQQNAESQAFSLLQAALESTGKNLCFKVTDYCTVCLFL